MTRTRLEARIDSLRPSGPLSEYYRIRGAGLFPQFASVVAGLRPGMDDWVRFSKLPRFTEFVSRLGLHVTTEVGFRPLPAAGRSVLGGDKLVTTRSFGVPPNKLRGTDEVHVFVARSREHLLRLRAAGWYPVVVNGRPNYKPFVDHLDFGRLLGYPPCCVEFFEKSNNWNRTNTYAEALRHTRGVPIYLANCFGKLRNFSLIFHMPCRYDCPRTLRFARALESYLCETEEGYLEECRALLRMPVLALSERDVLLLDGAQDRAGRIQYHDVANLARTLPGRFDLIREGDRIEVLGRFVNVWSGPVYRGSIECRVDRFLPEVPVLIGEWGG